MKYTWNIPKKQKTGHCGVKFNQAAYEYNTKIKTFICFPILLKKYVDLFLETMTVNRAFSLRTSFNTDKKNWVER